MKRERTPEQLAPGRSLDPRRFLDYEASATRAPAFQEVVERIQGPDMTVCDVGGASGRFLAAVMDRARFPFSGHILEVDPFYEDSLVDERLTFIHASVLDSGLPDASFDIVTFRHVLHHLVGETRKASWDLQQQGLEEMLRLAKPGGFLIFTEQVNRVRPFAAAVYHLSKWASDLGLKWRFFEAGRVVVSFMTPAQIERAVRQAGQKHPFSEMRVRVEKRKEALRWRLTLLMAFGGDATFVIERAD